MISATLDIILENICLVPSAVDWKAKPCGNAGGGQEGEAKEEQEVGVPFEPFPHLHWCCGNQAAS